MYVACAYLNCIIQGHLLEDALVFVHYYHYPSENDIGQNEWLDIVYLTNIKGRRLNRIYRQMPQSTIDDLHEQIWRGIDEEW